jgi:hypothetical protein
VSYHYKLVRCLERRLDETIERWVATGWRLIQVVEYGPTVLLLFERESA